MIWLPGTGMRVRYHFQLWKGLLHAGRTGVGWWNAGDLKEECVEGHCSPGPAAGGGYSSCV